MELVVVLIGFAAIAIFLGLPLLGSLQGRYPIGASTSELRIAFASDGLLGSFVGAVLGSVLGYILIGAYTIGVPEHTNPFVTLLQWPELGPPQAATLTRAMLALFGLSWLVGGALGGLGSYRLARTAERNPSKLLVAAAGFLLGFGISASYTTLRLLAFNA